MTSLYEIAQRAVISRSNVLLPTFKTLSLLAAGAIFYGGAVSLVRPRQFANDMGFPIPEVTTTSTKAEKETPFPDDDAEVQVRRPWMLIWAGRQFTIGTLILSFLATNDIKALSILWLAMSVYFPVFDSTTAYYYGIKDSVKIHSIPVLFTGWVGPLGLLLAQKK